MNPPLSNNPIHETVIEFRFYPYLEDQQIDIEELGEFIRKEYPNKQDIKQSDVQITIGANSPPPKITNLEPIFSYQSEDLNITAILAEDRVSLTWKNEYPGWEVFSNKWLDLWQVLQKNSNIKTISRLGVRFINHIKVPVGEVLDFDDFLTHGPIVPGESTPKTLHSFSHRAVFTNGDIECYANFLQAFKLEEKPKIVLDIDVFTINNLKPEIDQIKEKLGQIREYKNQLFSGSITPETKALYKWNKV